MGLDLEEGQRRLVCPQFHHIGLGSWYPHRENYVDLDPTYVDAYGQPLVRMTFDVRENERKMSVYLSKKVDEIAKATSTSQAPFEITEERTEGGVRSVVGRKTPQSRRRVRIPAVVIPYLPTKITGPLFAGVPKIMGKDLNRFIRSVGIVDRSKVLHSLRHRAKDKLRSRHAHSIFNTKYWATRNAQWQTVTGGDIRYQG